MDVALAEVDRNLELMLGKLSETTASGAKLTVFPECAQTGYCFDSLAEARPYAEPIPGPGTERMAAACERLQTFVVYGLLEADGMSPKGLTDFVVRSIPIRYQPHMTCSNSRL